MKSRPMIFSAPMVLAILTGQKTQTRRIYKPSECKSCGNVGEIHRLLKSGDMSIRPCPKCHGEIKCPYGAIGDRLWVREGYADILWDITASGKEIRKIIYKADEQHDATIIHPTWKTPLFMPRAASRIELEITGIWIERLRSISRGDCIAEGCPFPNMQTNDPIGWYADLWESINSQKHPWSDNPRVWVVQFKRVEVQS